MCNDDRIRHLHALLHPADMQKIKPANLSYSKPNSSWPIFGASGSTSKMDESDVTLSHDMARCNPEFGS